MRKTDDYWYKVSVRNNKANDALKDPKDGKYVSTGLSKKWEDWINQFVDERVDKMEKLMTFLYSQLENDWNVAKQYPKLSRTAPTNLNSDFENRMTALKKHYSRKVKRSGLKIVSGARPGTPNSPAARPATPGPSTPNIPDTQSPDRPGDPNTPTPAERKPGSSKGKEPMVIPDRTRPKGSGSGEQ
jgi:hypothetical protein